MIDEKKKNSDVIFYGSRDPLGLPIGTPHIAEYVVVSQLKNPACANNHSPSAVVFTVLQPDAGEIPL
jgi:hypothetical protein